MQHFYEAELQAICDRLLLMGRRCVEITLMTMRAVEGNDDEQAQRVLKADDEIDALEKEIDNECVRYISLRGPVASDVRLLTMAIKTCHELERVADEACSIAKRVSCGGLRPPSASERCFEEMATLAVDQLELALDAFVNRDPEKAFRVTQSDRAIDLLHRSHVAAMIESAQAQRTAVGESVDMIFISKSLERIGDHAKNMAEEIIFLLNADDVRHTPEMKNSVAR